MSDKTNDVDNKKVEVSQQNLNNEWIKSDLSAQKTQVEIQAWLKEQVNDLPITKALNSFPQMKQWIISAAKEWWIDEKTILTRLWAIHANLQNITWKWFPTIKNSESQNNFATAILITWLNVMWQKKWVVSSTANSVKSDILGWTVEKLMTGFSKVESSSAWWFIGALNDLPWIWIKLTNMIKYFWSYTWNVEFATANDALQFVNNPAFDKAEFNVWYDDKTQEAFRQITTQKNISLAWLNLSAFDKSIVTKIDWIMKQTTAYKTRIEKLDPSNLRWKVENMADVAVNLHGQVSAMAQKMWIEIPDRMQIDKWEGIAWNIPWFILLIAKLLIPNLDINQFDRAIQRRLKLSPEEVENIQILANTIPAPSSDKDKIPQDKIDALWLNAEQLSAYQQVNFVWIKKAVTESNPQIIPDFKIKQYVWLIAQSDNQELKTMVEWYKTKEWSYDIAKLMWNKDHIWKIIWFVFDQSDILWAAAKIEGLKLDPSKLTQLIIAEAVKWASKYEQAWWLAAKADKPQTAATNTQPTQQPTETNNSAPTRVETLVKWLVVWGVSVAVSEKIKDKKLEDLNMSEQKELFLSLVKNGDEEWKALFERAEFGSEHRLLKNMISLFVSEWGIVATANPDAGWLSAAIGLWQINENTDRKWSLEGSISKYLKCYFKWYKYLPEAVQAKHKEVKLYTWWKTVDLSKLQELLSGSTISGDKLQREWITLTLDTNPSNWKATKPDLFFQDLLAHYGYAEKKLVEYSQTTDINDFANKLQVRNTPHASRRPTTALWQETGQLFA